MKVIVKGKKWDIRFYDQKKYTDVFGKTSLAITLTGDSIIVFNLAVIRPSIVQHELLHAIFAECNVESADLNPIQVEEVCASIVASQLKEIKDLTKQIMEGAIKEFRKDMSPKKHKRNKKENK